ncbi:hypothetical protein AcetOrient_orf00386 [Acetobacter orientalis]|uniref:Uncharacterized protein n=1 Tax=Acetobacter orientalis TaxID=146474 RepID=A0A2Z5ZD57_9PROT|nr:hypothetical protein AcetOrient_orf00386 [Acetobacter orientalis]
MHAARATQLLLRMQQESWVIKRLDNWPQFWGIQEAETDERNR